MSDIFQEVEEDVRRERYEALWKKYGHYIIAGAAAVLLGVAGYKAYEAYDLDQRQQSSDRFRTAEAYIGTGQIEKARTEFLAIAKDGTAGYQTLAKFRLAGILQNENKRDEAVTLLRELSEGSDAVLADAARIRLAWTLAETAPRAEIEALLAPLNQTGNPWRPASAEILAFLELNSGARDKAIAAYEALAKDTAASTGMRQRAGAIAQHLKSNGGVAAVTAPLPAPANPETSKP